MSKAPPWAEHLVMFGASTLCIAAVAFSNPVYERLRDPAKHAVESTAIIAVLFAVVAGTAWLQFIVRPSLPPKEDDSITAQNVEERLKKWFPSHPGTVEPLPDDVSYFQYRITLSDHVPVFVCRRKDMYQDCLEVHGYAEIARDKLQILNENPSKLSKFTKGVSDELAARRMQASFTSPFQFLQVNKLIPLKELTEMRFSDAVTEVHADVRFAKSLIDTNLRAVME